MNRKLLYITIISVILAVLLAGCSYNKKEKKKDRYIAETPLSEDEVVAFIQEKIYEETGDQVTAEIVSKEQLRYATIWFDGPLAYTNVENGSEYAFKITSKENKDIVASAYYQDGFTHYDKDSDTASYIEEPRYSHNYARKKGFNIIKTEFINALEKRFDEYYIYNDISTDTGLDIFICSSDYEVIDDLLLDFRNTAVNYRDEEYVTYSVYIYKDEQIFRNKDFERYPDGHQDHGGQSHPEDMINQYTGKQAVALSNSTYFRKDFFESDGKKDAYRELSDIDPASFDYLIFYYDAEPNSFVAANRPYTTIYGVR